MKRWPIAEWDRSDTVGARNRERDISPPLLLKFHLQHVTRDLCQTLHCAIDFHHTCQVVQHGISSVADTERKSFLSMPEMSLSPVKLALHKSSKSTMQWR